MALQIDHSRVAGYFAAHWGNRDFDRPSPYASVVLAAGEHDIGWWEWEMSPSTLNDQGLPLDYHDGSLKFLGQLRLDFYKNAVDRVMTRDPYAAMLMAMHGVALMNAGYGKYAYPPDRTSDPRVKAYVDHQDALRLKILGELRQSAQYKQYCTDQQAWTNYEYMEIFDVLAQFVCNRYPLNSQARKLGPTNTLNDLETWPEDSTDDDRPGGRAQGDSSSFSIRPRSFASLFHGTTGTQSVVQRWRRFSR